MWSDRGEVFHNETFLKLLKQSELQIYSTHSDFRAVFDERFNRTLLDVIKEPMYFEGKACWLNHLDAAFETYKNCLHREIRMTPFEANNDKPMLNIIPSNKYFP